MDLNQIVRMCSCGSGFPSWEATDARGLFLARVCSECREERLSAFRPDVLTDSNYECDEPIEED